ncbi:bifunctional 5,10-methylenetetrahydrofolate dehydrogenase/5,10-methenyltetrahydrofolate cyclohydrolase [Streptomyces sp. TS71-3]|uniref:bifunctional 5,10-methylenetetrahydrofolate dehydrogenase/5,10-methenyltetrahydrofolate cyclohydrolase n=1 Tax=Streptomyces sp. TS71-3 TaxID=2733862 RepID=UPI001AFE7D63|nr:bifunctional 5,10-methylenetetrahydrofolate dehydrogenase/5,10-methenyltetrahydrofolate cyclohydrolase [Streptomyces sp. TS71-3]GHJ40190.1 bifunctional protein FolD [Streptomyces sp. TS71-3]
MTGGSHGPAAEDGTTGTPGTFRSTDTAGTSNTAGTTPYTAQDRTVTAPADAPTSVDAATDAVPPRVRELQGRELAAALRTDAAERAAELAARGTPPHLAVVTATADDSSAWYVRSIARSAEKAGLVCTVVDLGPEAPAPAIRARLRELSAEPGVHGIILQTPLPTGARLEDLASAIDPVKDVDGANPLSLGRLAAGLPAFAPATAEAVIALLDHHKIPLAGRHAVVVGRSTVVGKPAAHLLLDRNATVTVCHSRTTDLPALTRTADVLVAAVGRPRLITPDDVSPGTVIIDVGTNVTEDGTLVGDVDPAAGARSGAITPVPGGVGPVTTALLLQHTVRAALTL